MMSLLTCVTKRRRGDSRRTDHDRHIGKYATCIRPVAALLVLSRRLAYSALREYARASADGANA